MPDETSKDRHKGKLLTVRFSEDELATLESLRERLQRSAPDGVRFTQRMTILAALKRVREHLDILERDREMER